MPKIWVDGQDAVDGENFLLGVLPDRWSAVLPSQSSMDFEDYPVELRYVLALQPSRLSKVQDLLARGCGLGVRHARNMGLEVAPAVRRFAYLHEGLAYPWAERLLVHGRAPQVDERLRATAAERGWDADADLETLVRAADQYRHIAFIQTDEAKPTADDAVLLKDLNRDLRQASARHLLHATVGAAGPRPEPTLWTLAAAVFVLGPGLHVTGWLWPAAAVVLGTVALPFGWEIWRACQTHRAGGAGWQIKRNLWRNLPGLMLALGFGLLAAAVLPLAPLAGWLCLGLAVTGTHWARMFRALAVQRELYERLSASGKLDIGQKSQWLKHAMASSLGIWSGAALAAVLLAALIGYFWPTVYGNGWVLAALAAAPWVLYDAGFLVRIYVSDWIFRYRLNRLLKHSVLLMT